MQSEICGVKIITKLLTVTKNSVKVKVKVCKVKKFPKVSISLKIYSFAFSSREVYI